jgi:hypothetical protein
VTRRDFCDEPLHVDGTVAVGHGVTR